MSKKTGPLYELTPYPKRRQSGTGGGKSTNLTPEDLWERAVEYFKWCDAAFLGETKLFNGAGGIVEGEIWHKRPYTIQGLSVFVGISKNTFDNYRKRDEFKEVCGIISDIMYEQKFSGAAVGLYNAGIISSELGLVRKTESDLKSSDGSMTPGKVVAVTDMTDDELLAIASGGAKNAD